MSKHATPSALLLDLDDTIVSFSVGQANLWPNVLEAYAPQLGHVDALELARVVTDVISPVYWGDHERAAWGRLNMHTARRQVLTGALQHLGVRASDSAIEAAADAFTAAKEDAVAPLEEAVEVLAALRQRGLPLGLITNGSSVFQRRKLERYDLERYFELILVEEEFGIGKPHASIFEAALRGLGIDSDQAWMVGDNFEADIAGARQVGIAGVWLHHGRPQPAGTPPLASIDHIRELLELLG